MRYCLFVLCNFATVQVSYKSAQVSHDTPSQVNATAFKNGDWVELWWSGVQAPALDDMLALYAPADANVKSSAPVKYIWAIQSPSHMASGNGSYRRFLLLCSLTTVPVPCSGPPLTGTIACSFRLVNMRASVRFAFLRAGLDSPAVEAFSSSLQPENLNEPLQVHLALTGKAGWVARSFTCVCHPKWARLGDSGCWDTGRCWCSGQR